MEDNNLIGRKVLILCATYFYYGVLESEAHDVVWIADPWVVYETGDWSAKEWKRAERMPMKRYRIERSSIEGMGEVVRGK